MADKLIITFEEYTKIVEKLAIQIHESYKPTVLVGIMRGAAPIIDILSRILKLPIAYIVIQSYSGKGMEDQQGQLMFAREISSLAKNKDFSKVLLIDDLSDQIFEEVKAQCVSNNTEEDFMAIDNLIKAYSSTQTATNSNDELVVL